MASGGGCWLVAAHGSLVPAPPPAFAAVPALAALAEQAGIPAGVLNVVTGLDAAAIGGELTTSPVVRKISFTGSTRVGKLLMAQSAETVKKLSLELGGNAAELGCGGKISLRHDADDDRTAVERDPRAVRDAPLPDGGLKKGGGAQKKSAPEM